MWFDGLPVGVGVVLAQPRLMVLSCSAYSSTSWLSYSAHSWLAESSGMKLMLSLRMCLPSVGVPVYASLPNWNW